MDATKLRELLERVRCGALDVGNALDQMRDLPFANLGYAHVDHHRALRQGQPEVIMGEPKTVDQIAGIARELIAREQNVLITRLDASKAMALESSFPQLRYAPEARMGSVVVAEVPVRPQKIVLVTAGTGDIPVAEEASETLRMTGFEPVRLYDVGVAGIHRVLSRRDDLLAADAVIVAAGMEGALPSVVGGMVGCPVVAVPTSVGYGAHIGGITPLFAMLSSCAAGVVVVNVDNGFGAAMAVHRMFYRAKVAAEGTGEPG
ncbi:MAG: nickel pincer cofactor biosynthesis protein LarB [Polyangiaceae bacterium]|nr:nickel pincer cofactor biosynthesis protein LarB [Polyangiaceae bacterium]